MKPYLICAALISCLHFNAAAAQSRLANNIVGGVLFTGFTIGVSALASEYPREFGATVLLTAPLAGLDNPTGEGPYQFSIRTIGLMALGLYNLAVLSDDKYLKGNRFRQNLIDLPLVFVTSDLLGKHLDETGSLFAVPIGNGFGLMYARRF